MPAVCGRYSPRVLRFLAPPAFLAFALSAEAFVGLSFAFLLPLPLFGTSSEEKIERTASVRTLPSVPAAA